MDSNVEYVGHEVFSSLDSFTTAEPACRQLLLEWDFPAPALEYLRCCSVGRSIADECAHSGVAPMHDRADVGSSDRCHAATKSLSCPCLWLSFAG